MAPSAKTPCGLWQILGMAIQKFDAEIYTSYTTKSRRHFCMAGRPNALPAPARRKRSPLGNKNGDNSWILDQFFITVLIAMNVQGSDSSPGGKLYNDKINQP